MLTQRASLRVASDTDIVTPSERPALDETRIFDQLQGLVTQSEQRQQQELALWLTEFAREYDIQRLADQQRIEQEIGALEGVTDYLIRASSPR
jgi:hypothetical protein